MKNYVIYYFAIFMLLSCNKNDEQLSSYPITFQYETSEFSGEIMTFNSSGDTINVDKKYEQEDFLFEKTNSSCYPIDEIILTSDKEVLCNFSTLTTSFSKYGKYQITDDLINIEVYFENENNDTLFIHGDFLSDNIYIYAYGFKTYGPGINNNGTLSTSVSEFGDINVENLLNYTNNTDTIYIQQFYEIYNVVN